MTYNFFIVGGDLRILFLAEMLKKEGHNVRILGFDNISVQEYQETNIEPVKSITELDENDIIITSIPLSIDGENIYAPYSSKKIPLKVLDGKSFIGGKITKEIIEKIYSDTLKIDSGLTKDEINIKIKDKNIKVYDILKDEANVILNTIPTAEGAIAKAIQDTNFSLVNSNVLVLGFGNVGKTLCKMLKDLGANVYAEARKESDLAWIDVYGYNPIPLQKLRENICKMDIVFNTIPHLIVDKAMLILMSKETLIIDLASKPGGIDFESAKKLGINAYLYSGIPGKIAPQTSGYYILKYIKRIYKMD